MDWRKIDALKRQCYLPIDDRNDDTEYDMEKFAELIIRECAEVASRAENSETELRCMYEVVTQHFGVE